MINDSIFKAYDIRGLYPSDINEEVVYRIARAFGILRKKELGRPDNVRLVAGCDMRLSSPSLLEALKKGLVDEGIEVIDIGLSATPTFYFAVSFYGYDGGMLISASHNPKEYNGIKMTRDKASPVGQGIGMEELRDLTMKGVFSEPEQKGSIIQKSGVLGEQVKLEESYADLSKIRSFKIVADPANSMGGLFLDRLLADLPQIELIRMNWELDGNFPSHPPDPFKEENLADLKKRVKEEKADLGIATDGDGDRIFFVDEKGATVEPAILRGIMARIFLREQPGATICYDIRPGKITEDMIIEAGGKPSVTKVGHSLIKKQMIETGAVFGGESSGHFFIKFPHGVYEAPMIVILKLLRELSEKQVKLSEYIKPLQRYFHSGEINFKVQDKAGVLARLKEKYQDAQINDLDGPTFTYPDFWFNVRASNTEPLLRLNLEARTRELMEEKVGEVRREITE